jgi:RimJ/RimL family protein N-acetyltransferase
VRIETPRLILREWQESDLDPLAALCSDPVVMRFFPVTYGHEKSDALAWAMNDKNAGGGLGVLAAELRETGRFVGFIGLNYPIFEHPVARLPEIGWRLTPDTWGQGLAPEGARACLDYGFGVRNLPEIVAYTVAQNLPSQRVMEKIGMTREPALDFDHPDIPEHHRFRPHLVWRIANPAPSA